MGDVPSLRFHQQHNILCKCKEICVSGRKQIASNVNFLHYSNTTDSIRCRNNFDEQYVI